jgi:FKBP-type peptidyl-prolyl cis-trans isomerase FkpA
MKVFFTAILFAMISVSVCAAQELKSEEQKTLYTVGLIMARQLSVFNLTPSEFEVVRQGLMDGMTGKRPLVDIDAYKKKTQELAIARRDALGERQAIEAKEFIDKAAGEKGAVKTASGMVIISLKEGSGATPAATDTVKVNYRGTLMDGREFDSSYIHGKPYETPLNKSLKCWIEGLQMMKQGGSARLVCPPETAYGKAATGIIPPNATLVFDIDLLEVKK